MTHRCTIVGLVAVFSSACAPGDTPRPVASPPADARDETGCGPRIGCLRLSNPEDPPSPIIECDPEPCYVPEDDFQFCADTACHLAQAAGCGQFSPGQLADLVRDRAVAEVTQSVWERTRDLVSWQGLKSLWTAAKDLAWMAAQQEGAECLASLPWWGPCFDCLRGYIACEAPQTNCDYESRYGCYSTGNVSGCSPTPDPAVPDAPALCIRDCHPGWPIGGDFDCPADHWGCADGRCIPGTSVCDGFFDCPDDDDELACEGGSSSTGSESSSTDTTTEGSTDGSTDAGSEESTGAPLPDPEPPSDCAPDEWACTDGTCIYAGWQCDVIVDCPDGSDELAC